jgi:hypothetical protein
LKRIACLIPSSNIFQSNPTHSKKADESIQQRIKQQILFHLSDRCNRENPGWREMTALPLPEWGIWRCLDNHFWGFPLFIYLFIYLFLNMSLINPLRKIYEMMRENR